MNQQTINEEPVKTFTDQSFYGLSKREVKALCATGVRTYRAQISLRQVSATNIENVNMYEVGTDHVIAVVHDSSGIVRWGVMRAADEWVRLQAELDPMEVSDWSFARAQADAINTHCFYSNDFAKSTRRR